MKDISPAVTSLNHGRYQVISVLGTGGFGITYLCMDQKRNHLCAVKEYMPDNIASRESSTKDILPVPERRREYLHGKRRFCEEAALLSRMQKMPGIVHIRDLFEEHNTAYYVMDYIEGKNLKQLMREHGGKISFPEALSMIIQAAQAMEYVHRRAGIFHRDLSPENIMVMSDGTVRIIDFGSAKALSFHMDQQYSIVLKPGFAPPEQYSSSMRQGSFTDVYALASTFYYIVTGRKVPSAPGRLAGEDYIPLNRLVSDCSEDISKAVDKALLLNPEQRTQTMEEFMEGLGQRFLKNRPSEKRLAGNRSFDRRISGKRAPEESFIETVAKEYTDTIPRVWLLIESGASAGRLFALQKDQWISVGRNPKRSRVVIQGHGEISGLHFFVRYDSLRNRFYIVDRSTNGTYSKDGRLEKDRPYDVAAGTRLLIGCRQCAVVLGESRHAK